MLYHLLSMFENRTTESCEKCCRYKPFIKYESYTVTIIIGKLKKMILTKYPTPLH